MLILGCLLKKILITLSKSHIADCLSLIKIAQHFDFSPSLITFGKPQDFGFAINQFLKAKSDYVADFPTTVPCSV